MKRKRSSLSVLAAAVLCAAFVLTACAGIPVLVSQPVLPERGQPFAQVSLPKPRAFSAPQAAASLAAEATPSAPQPLPPAAEETPPPAQAETPLSTRLSLPIETPPPGESPAVEEQDPPGAVSAVVVPDTPTPEYKPPASGSSYAAAGGEHWIDVDLSRQRVYAYAGDTLVNSFLVSTGTWQTPTVTGKFNIWVKLRSATMSGPGYYLTNVPYVMYFYKSYGLHGTYWHNNFGTPMSHGCVNLSIPDAEWLYNFASVGTVVNVHY